MPERFWQRSGSTPASGNRSTLRVAHPRRLLRERDDQRAGGSSAIAGSSTERALVRAARSRAQQRVRSRTEASAGRVDLGTLTGVGLLAAGAAEIAVTRTIPAPPWFSLAWWALRTFTMFEQPVAEPESQARAAIAALPRRKRRSSAAAPVES